MDDIKKIEKHAKGKFSIEDRSKLLKDMNVLFGYIDKLDELELFNIDTGKTKKIPPVHNKNASRGKDDTKSGSVSEKKSIYKVTKPNTKKKK
ncbi:MAG: hypothetical protein PHN88_00560 [Ignavibacteria bacterium]|nr:hypothetical protein [Ignavibacteria bacterium]